MRNASSSGVNSSVPYCGGLKHDGVAHEQRRDQRRERLVQRIVVRTHAQHHAERRAADLPDRALDDHGKARTAVVEILQRGERLPDVVDGPVKLLLESARLLPISHMISCETDALLRHHLLHEILHAVDAIGDRHRRPLAAPAVVSASRPHRAPASLSASPSPGSCRSRAAAAFRPAAARTRAIERSCACRSTLLSSPSTSHVVWWIGDASRCSGGISSALETNDTSDSLVIMISVLRLARRCGAGRKVSVRGDDATPAMRAIELTCVSRKGC